VQKLAMIALFTATLAMAADVSGNWSGTITPETGEGPQPLYLVLHQSGDQLTGTGGPSAAEQHPMQNGRVQGDRLTFEVSAGKGTFVFDLKMTGDEIRGDLQIKDDQQTIGTKVSLKRMAALGK
jgi:hypothetical protein